MGKGDIKSRRGKLFSGSYGKRRPRKKTRKMQDILKIKPKAEIKTELEIPKTDKPKSPKAETPVKEKEEIQGHSEKPVKKQVAKAATTEKSADKEVKKPKAPKKATE